LPDFVSIVIASEATKQSSAHEMRKPKSAALVATSALFVGAPVGAQLDCFVTSLLAMTLGQSYST
jgi:hypothetical protein